MDFSKKLKLDKVFCINLDKRSDRWKKAESDIIKNGFPSVEKYTAIDGELLSDEFMKENMSIRAQVEVTQPKHSHESISSKGAIGCYMSHTNIWKNMIKNNWKRVAIIEDDGEFDNDFIEKFDETIKEIPDNYDTIHFGYNWIISPFTPVKDACLYKCNGYFWGTYGYIITIDGAKKLLEHAFPMEVHVDAYISFRCLLDSSISSYFFEKSLIDWNKSKSDISAKEYALNILWLPEHKFKKESKCDMVKYKLNKILALLERLNIMRKIDKILA